MKLKQTTDDFQVEEITDLVAGEVGSFAFYRLDKAGWTTPDALDLIRKRLKVDLRRLSYAGLKDRHAHTRQYLTIHNGPAHDLDHQTIHLHYLGRLGAAYTSGDIRCNRFGITLRDLDEAQVSEIDHRLEVVARLGVPNYFDDQRFGSVAGGEFIAAHLVRGRFEEALRLALTAPYAFDRAEQKREKQILRDHWGDWAACRAALPRGHAWGVVEYLRIRNGDFRGAVGRLRPELRGLYLSAYQSHLWNRTLARWLDQHAGAPLRRISLRLGEVPLAEHLSDEATRALADLHLPLATSRWKPEEDDPRLPLVEAVLAEEGLTLRDMQVRGVRELFFSRGDRPALARVDALETAWADDERHPGRKKLTLSFRLPRGSYATLVVKAIVG